MLLPQSCRLNAEAEVQSRCMALVAELRLRCMLLLKRALLLNASADKYTVIRPCLLARARTPKRRPTPAPSHRGTIIPARARHPARPSVMPPTYRCPAVTPTAPTAGVLPAAVGPTVGPAVELACYARGSGHRTRWPTPYSKQSSTNLLDFGSTSTTGPRYWHRQYPRPKRVTGITESRLYTP
jgi:hypothetical protein